METPTQECNKLSLDHILHIISVEMYTQIQKFFTIQNFITQTFSEKAFSLDAALRDPYKASCFRNSPVNHLL